jgi:tRNA(Ile)-lysidine synthase
MPANTLLQRFVEHQRQAALLQPADKVLLAVSGGVDSVVMAHLFAKAGYSFGIAHCNFHLRGDDSNADEEFVHALAQQYQVPFYCAEFDTTAFAKEHRLSIEEAARKQRYDFFHRTASENGYSFIATAHHLNDAIETFFINLIRGTGLTGLHGIRAKNGNVIRPLLPFTRQEIADYAAANKLPFHEDYTNNDTLFLRNKIRHNLMPVLKEISPQIERTMAQNMGNLADAEQIFRQAIVEKQQQIFRCDNDEITIAKSDIRQLVPAQTALFEMLRPFGFNATAVGNLLSSLESAGKQLYSASHTILIDRHNIIIRPSENCPDSPEYQIFEDAVSIDVPISLTFTHSQFDGSRSLVTDSDTVIVDSSKLKFPLVLRKWRTGDRFRPFGMKGSRKVSDFFKDNRLSLFEKNEKWLLCNADGEIIWIVGMRMDDSFAATQSTKEITIIKNNLYPKCVGDT